MRPLKRLIDQLMLLHAAFALEGGGDDVGGVVVAVATQVFDGDLGVGQAFPDQPLDRRRVHRHQSASVGGSEGAAM